MRATRLVLQTLSGENTTMFTFAKRLGAVALTGAVAWTLSASSARAGLFPVISPIPSLGLVATPFGGLFVPGLSSPFSSTSPVPQAAWNISTMGDAVSHWPGLRPGELQTLNTNSSEFSTRNVNTNTNTFDAANVIRESSRAHVTFQEARLK